MYNECTVSGSSKKPWCPYKLKSDMTYADSGINKWDYCTPSCSWTQRHPNLGSSISTFIPDLSIHSLIHYKMEINKGVQ